MEEQSLNERRQLLQKNIFAHSSVLGFNPYSQAVLSRLSRCHTASIGVHHITVAAMKIAELCTTSIITVATDIALVVEARSVING